jgi:dienelactone hydrolase
MKRSLGTRDDRSRAPILRTRRRYLLRAALPLVVVIALFGIYKLTRARPLPPPGKNALIIRGQPQDVYFYPAQGAPANAQKVLFLCGDGGWEGLSLSIAAEMAKAGNDVYGFDTKRYLESFTTGNGALKDTDVQQDLAQVAKWMQTRWRERVTLVGQSEGAGLAVLAAAGPDNRDVFSGVIALGISATAELGWSLHDDITYITHADPDEPLFHTTDYLPKVAPLPFCSIQSSVDEFITKQEADALFAAAEQPKLYEVVQAQSHSFGGNLDGFFQALREGLAWANQNAR